MLSNKQLRNAKPVCSRGEFEDVIERLEPAMRLAHPAALFALLTGPAAILHAHTDQQAAIEAARAIRPARQSARLLRRLALIAEIGALRAESAIRMRPDHKLITEAAEDGK